MSLAVLKFVLSFHLDLGTFELHIQLSKLVSSSYPGTSIYKMHVQLLEFVVLGSRSSRFR